MPATFATPPSRLKMSDAVAISAPSVIRKEKSTGLPNCDIATFGALGHNARVMDTRSILAELARRGVKKARIAETLGVQASRVTELYKGERRLDHDEAVKLVETFDLERAVPPLTEPIARLLVLHVANELRVPIDPEAPQVQELALDFRAFSEYAAHPARMAEIARLEAFLEGRASDRSTKAA